MAAIAIGAAIPTAGAAAIGAAAIGAAAIGAAAIGAASAGSGAGAGAGAAAGGAAAAAGKSGPDVVQVADDAILKLVIDQGPGDEDAAVNVVDHDLLVVGDLVKDPGQVVVAVDEDPPGFYAGVPDHVNAAGLGQSVGLGVEVDKPVVVSRLGARPIGVRQALSRL